MAGEFENIFMKIGIGDSVLVEGSADPGKAFFCRLLLRQGLDADFPVAVLSFHPEAHIAWFREYAGKGLGRVRHAEAPDNLTEMGIALKEQAKGCRFVYIDFFEILSAKLDASDILDAIGFNAKKLKAGKASLMQAVNPESIDSRQMARLREIFDVVIEVKRKGEKLEYRYMKHPTEFDEEWHSVSLGEVVVPRRTITEFCRTAMEFELRNAGHYARNFHKFDENGRKQLFGLSQASSRHFSDCAQLLQREVEAMKVSPASDEELLKILEEGMLEERVMKERYNEYANESPDEKARGIFARLSGEEKAHELIVEELKGKIKKE